MEGTATDKLIIILILLSEVFSHLQDFLAVYELKNNRICKSNDVFIPGHGLDILCHVINTEAYDEEIVTSAVKRTVWKKISYRDKSNAVYRRFKA